MHEHESRGRQPIAQRAKERRRLNQIAEMIGLGDHDGGVRKIRDHAMRCPRADQSATLIDECEAGDEWCRVPRGQQVPLTEDLDQLRSAQLTLRLRERRRRIRD